MTYSVVLLVVLFVLASLISGVIYLRLKNKAVVTDAMMLSAGFLWTVSTVMTICMVVSNLIN